MLELAEKPAHDLVEQLDLLGGMAARRRDEQVGDALQRLGAPPDVAPRERILELVDHYPAAAGIVSFR